VITATARSSACFLPLGYWDREFESPSKYGCLNSTVCVVMSCVGKGLVQFHVDSLRLRIWTTVEWCWQGKNLRTRRKICPSANLSITNPTWIDPSRRGDLASARTVNPQGKVKKWNIGYICIARACWLVLIHGLLYTYKYFCRGLLYACTPIQCSIEARKKYFFFRLCHIKSYYT
jgi:hypothetical protein